MQTWFEELLQGQGFELSHRIITLHWERAPLPPASEADGALIRPMTLDDLGKVERVDVAAFPPIWQHSRAYLELAFRQAAIAAVAEKDGRLVGYQISTATPLGGHLARLAVEPGMQGHGIGRALLQDLLAQFMRRGARAVTVNTQTNNQASLALYQRMGFVPTREEYPVYQTNLV
jgi:ribosomal protein S18 acetylase RimI-like enzyme